MPNQPLVIFPLNTSIFYTQNLELASYDGTLIWKIADYKRRKADAVRGRQMSIYSHPFYSSRFGYKMCCRVRKMIMCD